FLLCRLRHVVVRRGCRRQRLVHTAPRRPLARRFTTSLAAILRLGTPLHARGQTSLAHDAARRCLAFLDVTPVRLPPPPCRRNPAASRPHSLRARAASPYPHSYACTALAYCWRAYLASGLAPFDFGFVPQLFKVKRQRNGAGHACQKHARDEVQKRSRSD